MHSPGSSDATLPTAGAVVRPDKRRVKHDRAIAMGATRQPDAPQPPPDEMP